MMQALSLVGHHAPKPDIFAGAADHLWHSHYGTCFLDLDYTAMQTEEGWGDTIPDLLRNGDWNYAVFAKDGTLRSGVNQAKCLACHKPLADDSYLFTLEQLTEKVGG